MAQRFGGKYSPGGDDAAGAAAEAGDRNAFDGRQPSTLGGRTNMLFVVALVFVIPAFRSDPQGLMLGLAATGLMLLAAWLTREGVLAQEAYDTRRVARRPAIPRKIFAAVLTGAALFAGGMVAQAGLFYPILYAIAGAALHLMAFGPDPLADKGMAGVDAFQTDRVARAVADAEKLLAGMKDAILRAGDRQLEARIDRFASTARAMFRTVEGDPRDLTVSRKYLSVYLQGARDATVKFADLYAQGRNPQVRADYEALLTDLETNFASRTQSLLSNNHSDLNVEIDVLRERLKYETPN